MLSFSISLTTNLREIQTHYREVCAFSTLRAFVIEMTITQKKKRKNHVCLLLPLITLSYNKNNASPPKTLSMICGVHTMVECLDKGREGRVQVVIYFF